MCKICSQSFSARRSADLDVVEVAVSLSLLQGNLEFGGIKRPHMV